MKMFIPTNLESHFHTRKIIIFILEMTKIPSLLASLSFELSHRMTKKIEWKWYGFLHNILKLSLYSPFLDPGGPLQWTLHAFPSWRNSHCIPLHEQKNSLLHHFPKNLLFFRVYKTGANDHFPPRVDMQGLTLSLARSGATVLCSSRISPLMESFLNKELKLPTLEAS